MATAATRRCGGNCQEFVARRHNESWCPQTPDDDQRPTSSRVAAAPAAGPVAVVLHRRRHCAQPVLPIEAREGAAGRHPEKPLPILCGAIASETQAVLSFRPQ